MRVIMLLLMLLAIPPAWAQAPAGTTSQAPAGTTSQAPADSTAIQSVIGNQIEAFRHDDATSAFSLASPMIQGMFGTPENFLAMVAHGYPPVYRPGAVRFTDLVTIDGVLTQKVELLGPDGRAYLALYAMEKQPDGTWKINGCQLTESESVAA